eukprot:4101385-Alexandrium_andersonii.AAC.1
MSRPHHIAASSPRSPRVEHARGTVHPQAWLHARLGSSAWLMPSVRPQARPHVQLRPQARPH